MCRRNRRDEVHARAAGPQHRDQRRRLRAHHRLTRGRRQVFDHVARRVAGVRRPVVVVQVDRDDLGIEGRDLLAAPREPDAGRDGLAEVVLIAREQARSPEARDLGVDAGLAQLERGVIALLVHDRVAHEQHPRLADRGYRRLWPRRRAWLETTTTTAEAGNR